MFSLAGGMRLRNDKPSGRIWTCQANVAFVECFTFATRPAGWNKCTYTTDSFWLAFGELNQLLRNQAGLGIRSPDIVRGLAIG